MTFELATFTTAPVHSYASAPFPEEHQGVGGHRTPRLSSGPSEPGAALCMLVLKVEEPCWDWQPEHDGLVLGACLSAALP